MTLNYTKSNKTKPVFAYISISSQGTTYDARYPYAVLSVMMMVGATSGMFLPETLHQKLPETLAEAHMFGRDQVFWSLPKKKVPEFTDISIKKATKEDC